MNIKFERRNQTAPYCYEGVIVEAQVADGDFVAAAAAMQKLMEATDAVLPAATDITEDAPWPATTAPIPAMNQQPPVVAMPQPMPYTPQVPNDFPTMLAQAERIACPCGDTAGQPLCAIPDKDLQYLATKYKKTDDGVKQAAATVLAARQSGLTTIHP